MRLSLPASVPSPNQLPPSFLPGEEIHPDQNSAQTSLEHRTPLITRACHFTAPLEKQHFSLRTVPAPSWPLPSPLISDRNSS